MAVPAPRRFVQPPGSPLPPTFPPERPDLLESIKAQAELGAAVELKRKRLEVEEAARQQIHEAHARAAFTEPEIHTNVAELSLTVGNAPDSMIIGGGLMGEGDLVTITGMAKKGKTTTILNVTQCLVDGIPFLDHEEFAIERPYRVLVLDGEMTRDLWVHRLLLTGIKHTERVRLLPFRGYSLDLTTDFGTNYIIKQLEAFEAEVWIIDNASKFTASLESENDVVGINRFHENIQRAMEQVDPLIGTILVHHQGHGGARGRGSSAFRDRPDTLWDMVKPNPPQFQVEGRHRRIFTVRTAWHEATNRLTYRTGETPDPIAEKAESLRPKIMAAVLGGAGTISAVSTKVDSNRRYREVKAEVEAMGAEGILKVTKHGRRTYVEPGPLQGGEKA